ncbi:MAG: tetratricopeptide repeat protein [Polyangiaceae bacterium]
MFRRSLFAVLCFACGCARSLPARFTAARDAAEAAYAQGDYRGAARHWHDATAQAPSPRERNEASYREAASLERAGDEPGADAIYAQLERGSGERAERAAYARAEMAERRTAKTDALVDLRGAIVRFPNSGLARTAAARYLAREEARSGPTEALLATERLLADVRGSELEETLGYFRAKRLEQLERSDAARSAYLELATRFPYPFGAFWDEALLAAARLDLAAGRPREALQSLERLLRERESSHLNGSYERVGYAEARFLRARILRDELGDARAARSEFRRVWNDHPTSRLRDDALFEEALTALASGDASAACAPAKLLTANEHESRFAGCASELCPGLKQAAADCRPYIRTRIEQARSAANGSPHSSSSSR